MRRNLDPTRLFVILALVLGGLFTVALKLPAQEDPITADPTDPVLGMAWEEKAPGTIVVTKVGKGSPAGMAKLQPGDVVLAVNNKKLANGGELEKALRDLRGGEKAALLVARGRKQATLEITAPQVGASNTSIGFFGAKLKIDPKGRIVVGEVSLATAAEDAGLKEGDVLIAIEGKAHQSVEDLVEYLTDLVRIKKPGDKVAVVIQRGDDSLKATIVLPESNVAAPPPVIGEETGVLRVPAEALVLGVTVTDAAGRVTITDVLEGAPAEKGGIRPGDVILAVQGQKIATFDDLDLAVRGFKAGQKVAVDILRGDKGFVATVIPVVNKAAVPDVALDTSIGRSRVVVDRDPVVVDRDAGLAARVVALEAQVDELNQVVAGLAAEVANLKKSR